MIVSLTLAHVTDRYVGWLNDPETVRFTEARHQTHTLESTRGYVSAQIADPSVVMWAVMAPDHIGNVRLSEIDPVHGLATIALLLGERRGQGLGTRVIAEATEAAFGMGVRKVCAGIYEPNIASLRAFEKAGYDCEARLRRHAFFEGGYVDVLKVARLR